MPSESLELSAAGEAAGNSFRVSNFSLFRGGILFARLLDKRLFIEAEWTSPIFVRDGAE
jgi:hypothetical protein